MIVAVTAVSAQAPRPADIYRGVLAEYVVGADLERAVIPLQSWARKEFEEAADDLIRRGDRADIEAAGVLQLEFGLATSHAPSALQHFAVGARLVDSLRAWIKPTGMSKREAADLVPRDMARFASTWHAVAGSVFLAINDAPRARPFLRDALRIEPRSAAAQTLWGAADELDITPPWGGRERNPIDVRRRMLAIAEVYRVATEYDPDYGPAHLRLARLQMQLGDLAQARSSIDRAQALATHPQQHYQAALTLGAIVQSQGDLLGARASYERAMKIVPNSQTTTVALGYLDLLAGRPDQAQARAQAFMADPQDDPYWWEMKNGGLYRDGLIWLRIRVRR
jgi:Tfp pilus assembly protein PilF